MRKLLLTLEYRTQLCGLELFVMNPVVNWASNLRRFDMLPRKDVKWWGAIGDDVNSFLGGKVISDAKVSGLYKNGSLQVSLLRGLTWENIKVLSVLDGATASNFGHIVLQSNYTAPPPTKEVA